jgi:hypothetical protein
LAKGKRTRVSAQTVALAALSGYEASEPDDSLAWLSTRIVLRTRAKFAPRHAANKRIYGETCDMMASQEKV